MSNNDQKQLKYQKIYKKQLKIDINVKIFTKKLKNDKNIKKWLKMKKMAKIAKNG